MREFAFEFRDKSIDSAEQSHNHQMQKPMPNYDVSEENNIYEDPINIPMEEVKFNQQRLLHKVHPLQHTKPNECDFKH